MMHFSLTVYDDGQLVRLRMMPNCLRESSPWRRDDGNPALSPITITSSCQSHNISPVSTVKIKPHDRNRQHLMMVQCKNNVGGRQLIIIQGAGGVQDFDCWLKSESKCPKDDFHGGSFFRLFARLLPLFVSSPDFWSRALQWQKRAHTPLPPSTATTLAPSSLQSGLKPLDDIFLVSLAAREDAEWALLAATKRNEIEIPQAPFITAAQTLQGLKLSGQLYSSAAAGPGWGRVLLQRWPHALWGAEAHLV